MNYPRLSVPLVSALLLAAVTAPAAAEIAYVTDRLLLGLYAEADSNSQQYRTLPSGTKLDIRERQGLYARIVTEDGLEGWVKYHFLVSDPPAVVRIKSLEEQLAEQGQPGEAGDGELETLRAQNLALNEKLLQLQGELSLAQQALSDQLAGSTAGAVDNTDAQAAPQDPLQAPAEPEPAAADESAMPDAATAGTGGPDGERVLDSALSPGFGGVAAFVESNTWSIGALLLGTVPGFLLGANWMSRRVRRRFGGMRVW